MNKKWPIISYGILIIILASILVGISVNSIFQYFQKGILNSSGYTSLLLGIVVFMLINFFQIIFNRYEEEKKANIEKIKELQDTIEKIKNSELINSTEPQSVFHDRIDKHISELYIQNYKCLQNLKITTLSQINLFAGENNRGKTTLLEAIYLLTRQNDFDGLLELVRRRGKVSQEQLLPEWLLEQLPDEIKVKGIFDNQAASILIHHYPEDDNTLDKSKYLESIEINTEFGEYQQKSLTRLFNTKQRETLAKSIKLLCPVTYSSPFFLNEPHRYIYYYHKSVQSKALPKIFEFLRKTVLPTLNDIRLTDERQRFVVDDDNFVEGVDLSAYGEGLQRIFFTSLLFASSQNGIVLIDEFENAIHVELIEKFAPFIHDLAKLFNVQVFLTSHSKECIDAFVKHMPTTADFSYHALVEEDNNIAVRQFDGERYQRLIKAGNVDLRRAR
ncbi:MAG: AAA family ATPase [Thiotrichaceae bacterium]|nr:AAA family ATPase [Thiotrichaceae bacterium]